MDKAVAGSGVENVFQLLPSSLSTYVPFPTNSSGLRSFFLVVPLIHTPTILPFARRFITMLFPLSLAFLALPAAQAAHSPWARANKLSHSRHARTANNVTEKKFIYEAVSVFWLRLGGFAPLPHCSLPQINAACRPRATLVMWPLSLQRGMLDGTPKTSLLRTSLGRNTQV